MGEVGERGEGAEVGGVLWVGVAGGALVAASMWRTAFDVHEEAKRRDEYEEYLRSGRHCERDDDVICDQPKAYGDQSTHDYSVNTFFLEMLNDIESVIPICNI